MFCKKEQVARGHRSCYSIQEKSDKKEGLRLYGHTVYAKGRLL